MVASAVGGIPELINKDTGWPVKEHGEVSDYILALHNMIDDPKARLKRGTALAKKVQDNYTKEIYEKDLVSVMFNKGKSS